MRWGAPPVINPTGSLFPNSTLLSPCLSLTLPVTSQSSTTYNLTNPAAGTWFIAAHLPEDDGRIEQKVSVAGKRKSSLPSKNLFRVGTRVGFCFVFLT